MPSPTAACRTVRSIRNDRVTSIELAVRANETVRDGFEPDQAPTAETSVLDPRTGRHLELTARQMTAIHLLTMGKSVVATAKSLEIGVSTLHRWKSKHPAFVAELNRRQHEVFERTVDKLRSTMSKAVEELWNLMNSRNSRDRLEIAMKLLPLMQPRKWIEPIGPSDADAVVETQVREKRRARGEEPLAEITEAERDAAIAEAEGAIADVAPSADAASSAEVQPPLPLRERAGERGRDALSPLEATSHHTAPPPAPPARGGEEEADQNAELVTALVPEGEDVTESR